MYRHTVMPATHIKLDVVIHAKSNQFSLMLHNLFAFVLCSLCHTVFFFNMSSEVGQSSNVADKILAVGTKSAVTVGSKAPSSTSSSNMVDQTMVRKEIPPLYEYWKASTVTDKDIANYYGVD
jgi:hypothetical protein